MSDANETVRVTFEPTGRTVHVLAGSTAAEAAGRAGLAIDTPCGGAGTCGRCRVRFMTGTPPASQADAAHLDEAERRAGWRLACRAVLDRDATIVVPETSLFAETLQILTDTDAAAERAAGEPPHRACPVALVEGQPNYGIAVDVGTTTLVAELIELPGGREVEVAADINPQVAFGDDVVSRIARATASSASARELKDAVVGKVNDLVDWLCEAASISQTTIRGISLAGNTTMQHLLAGWSVENLAHLPFEPARAECWSGPAGELGLSAAEAEAYVMPVIGGFVGGDTVAGVLSADLLHAGRPTAMIDIGTNGEIVVAAGGTLLAASAAAGPAFEGARISSGMRAASGAIEKIEFADDVRFSTIGGAPAIGLCGSALVDLAAELLGAGLVDETGRLVDDDEIPAGVPEAIRRRLVTDAAGQREFLLTAGDGRAAVTLRQRDVRELQLAAGALRAGLTILLGQLGLVPGDLDAILLAGGFGSFLRRDNARRIGLIPPDVPLERVRCVGNVSLHGAKWALVSRAARQRCDRIRIEADHVELSADPSFQMAFAEAMLFPG